MAKDNPNKIVNGGEGTFIGKALRGIVGVAPDVLNILGTVTGVDGLNKLGDAIRKTDSINSNDKDLLLAELEKDIAVESEITKRWLSDNNAKDWLPRNIRPLVVANFTLLIDFVLIASQFGRPIAEAYLPILMTMGVTAIGGYFTLREFGKSKHS
tara:strand:+ start:9704 stop:10168 length:465 start_codon:yes stop_codon:yes gene_type:complete